MRLGADVVGSSPAARQFFFIYIYIKIFAGDAYAYRDTNNNSVGFDIALRPFVPFFSKSTWEFVTQHKIPGGI